MSALVPLKKLGAKHILLAYMVRSGKSTNEIAAQLDYAPARVSQLKSDPLIATFIEKLQKDLKESSLASLNAMIEAEAIPTFNRIKQLRDQDVERGVALRASEMIFDRVAPKKAPEQQAPQTVIQIHQQVAVLMQKAMQEDPQG